jgi:predicted ATP-dependent endonuclease of OLD family
MKMHLKKLSITGYRSIKKEEILLLDDKTTILIGANDHGKSNLLAAIQCLNDDFQIKPTDKNWDLVEGDQVQIRWYFSIAEEIQAKLEEIEIKEESTSSSDTVEKCFPINNSREIIFIRDSKTNTVNVESLPLKIPITKEKNVLQLRPRIELFESPTANLTDQINLSQLDQPQYEFMQGIFRLAGIWERRKEIFSQNDKTSKILDEASKRLTEVLNDKWKQGKDLEWKLEHTGTNGDHIIIKIKDPAIQNQYTRPSLRSSGFRTYFLLSMITFARTQNKPSNSYVFLFDEPGTYLHPYAQLDLQRSFETIADKTQVIYTTHSLFLINKNYPDRNRVISKTKQGTKIDQKPFTKNWKSVRESLGILLSNNFLIAEKTLLVEGPSDVIYILEAMKKLKKTGGIDIDLNDFSCVDAGNLENYVAMAKLMLSEGREVVALIDGDNGGDNIENQLNKICEAEIKSSKVKIIKLPKNKSTEDIFADIELLKKAIKQVCQNLIDSGVRKLKKGDLDTKITEIKLDTNKTLGKVIDDITKGWFDKEEKVSKLSIALEYENLRQDESLTVSDDALSQLLNIKKELCLRGERSVNEGVFEEIEE